MEEKSAGFDTLTPRVSYLAAHLPAAFDTIGQVDDKEVGRIRRAGRVLATFRNTAHLYWAVSRNLQEFANCKAQMLVERATAKQIVDPPALSELAYVDINRRLMNLLSSTRMFLDHTLTELRRRGPRPAADEFEKATHDAYDRSRAYRFFAGLRNYAQHCGFPISKIHISAKPKDGGIVHRVEFLFEKKVLAQHNWNKTQTNDLAELPPQFDAFTLVDEYMIEMATLQQVRVRLEPAVVSAAQRIREFIKPARERHPQNKPVLVRLMKFGKGMRGRLTIEQIPVDVAEHVAQTLAAQRSTTTDVPR